MFCPSCGASVPTTAQRFCKQCGSALPPGNAAGPPAEGGSGAAALIPLYAGFWRRFWAFCIDYLVTVVAIAGCALLGVATAGKGVMALAYFIGPWLYYALLESSSGQATLGKMALGIKVTSLTGERIGFGRASGRYFAKILSSLTLMIGYVMAGFTSRRQALHDLVAGTLVVHKPAQPADIANAGPAPQVSGGVIALLVIVTLLFGPFGIGILAAIAIPAYQSYTARAQVAEGLSLAAGYETAVADAVSSGQVLRSVSSGSLGMSESPDARYVTKIEVINGIITITYGRAATRVITGKSLLMVPGIDPSGNLVWVCGRAALPAGYEMVRRDLREYTTVPDADLPLGCRG